MTTPVQTRWETDVFPARATRSGTPWGQPRLGPPNLISVIRPQRDAQKPLLFSVAAHV